MKKLRSLLESYGSGEWIRIRKDSSIFTDPDSDPFGQKRTVRATLPNTDTFEVITDYNIVKTYHKIQS